MPSAAAFTAAVAPALFYKDPMKMFHWSEEAFGFEPSLLITDADGNLGHSQMAYGNGMIMVGTKWTEKHRSPASVDGRNTQTVHVHLNEDARAHCERAKAAGAEIIAEPEMQFYGACTYRARDPEGHMWTFSQAVQDLQPEEWKMPDGMGYKTWPVEGA